MEKQNLLIAALIHLVKFQSTHCATARERVLMMFDALSELKETSPDLEDLYLQANKLLVN
jgi:hypothetical protein